MTACWHRDFFLDKSETLFQSHRGIINEKSELGIRAESFSPELSSLFRMNSARVNDRAIEKKEDPNS